MSTTERAVATWADLSADGVYRYSLGRRWDDGPLCGWVMLNPSTADAEDDDPTIRRCVGFAKAWGYGGILVGNVYAYRATQPDVLRRLSHTDATGPENAAALTSLAELGDVVCAWGANARAGSGEAVAAHLWYRGARLRCLGRTKGGQPRHPLYVAATTPLEDYR